MYLNEAERTNNAIYDDFKLKKNAGLLIYIKNFCKRRQTFQLGLSCSEQSSKILMSQPFMSNDRHWQFASLAKYT